MDDPRVRKLADYLLREGCFASEVDAQLAALRLIIAADERRPDAHADPDADGAV